ncbi:MAG: phage terminase small subunit P27 family [Eubacterium sp.]|nr:phage terminase small subunit P27 family [Candidatus Colimonas fimequi]
MARPRKVISLQTGNLKTSTQDQRAYEESLVKTGSSELEFIKVRHLLNDKVACDAYKRVLANLQSIDIIGNLDRDNIIAYCNAYSLYVKANKEMAKSDFKMTIITSLGEKPNPVIKIANDAYTEMAKAGEKLGMSVSSRLKAAAAKAKSQEDDLQKMFGGI